MQLETRLWTAIIDGLKQFKIDHPSAINTDLIESAAKRIVTEIIKSQAEIVKPEEVKVYKEAFKRSANQHNRQKKALWKIQKDKNKELVKKTEELKKNLQGVQKKLEKAPIIKEILKPSKCVVNRIWITKKLAYLRYQQRGHSDILADWFEAEQILQILKDELKHEFV